MNVLRDPMLWVKLWDRNGPREPPSLYVTVHAITSHTTIDQEVSEDLKKDCSVFGADYNAFDA
jgi:hypothetical protein